LIVFLGVVLLRVLVLSLAGVA
ncbi:YggT family protein, partial [Xanthomonas citri pv. citri]|nr:YggT family protein [Xanthomonas citri pv. citri]